MELEKYTEQKERLPKTGRQVIGNRESENIIVYQAFNPRIAAYAIAHQRFGGSDYSFNRMSWIKPGFLWMMYRAGWGEKENQERILQIEISLVHFKIILQQATFSSYQEDVYASKEEWKAQLVNTEVRLQWDPDHDPLGNKQERKAIQIGMKGEILKKFCSEWIVKVEDITAFAEEQYRKVKAGNISDVDIPFEEIINLNDPVIEKRIGISKNMMS
jgi:hypothetical protein